MLMKKNIFFFNLLFFLKINLIFSMDQNSKQEKVVGWQEPTFFLLKETEFQENLAVQKKNISIILEYVPEKIDQNNISNLLILVHGQNNATNPEFYDSNKLLFQAFKRYAESLSFKDNSTLTLLSFRWSDNSNLERINQDSLKLSSLMSLIKNHKIIIIAFDLGGLVAKAATGKLDAKIKIDRLILLGTPVYESIDKKFMPRNYDTIINFYSTGDIWQFLQGISAASLVSSEQQNRKIGSVVNDNKSFDIRVQIDGKDISREDLKRIIYKFPEIFEILVNYIFHRDLDLNISFDFDKEFDKYKLQLAVRSKKEYEEIPDSALKEITFSNKQKLMFKQIYNRDISEKSTLFEKLKTNFL